MRRSQLHLIECGRNISLRAIIGRNSLNVSFFMAKAACHKKAGVSHFQPIATKNDVCLQLNWAKNSTSFRISQLHFLEHSRSINISSGSKSSSGSNGSSNSKRMSSDTKSGNKTCDSRSTCDGSGYSSSSSSNKKSGSTRKVIRIRIRMLLRTRMSSAYTKLWLSNLGRPDRPQCRKCSAIETIEQVLLHGPAYFSA